MMDQENRIERFEFQYDFLSNFYPAYLEYDGLTYLNSESAYQAAKCADPEEKKQFLELQPNRAKKLGNQVAIRADWEDVKLEIMEQIVYEKFTQNPRLAFYLLETGDAEIIEGNRWGDVYWGVDLCTGEGENHLGKILMRLRAYFLENGLPEVKGERIYR